MALPLSLVSALRLKASLVFAFMAASSVPSPLYALYRAEWGFSPAVLTTVFAVELRTDSGSRMLAVSISMLGM